MRNPLPFAVALLAASCSRPSAPQFPTWSSQPRGIVVQRRQPTPEEAEAAYQRGLRLAAGSPGEAVLAFTDALRANPSHAQAYAHRGAVHLSQGEIKGAAYDCELALRLGLDRPEVHITLAGAYFARQDIDRTLEHCAAALRGDPNDPRPHVYRGRTYNQLGRLDEALDELNAAIRLKASAPAYAARADTRLRQGAWQAAVADAEAALRLDARLAEAYFYRAIARGHLGDAGGGEADRLAANALDVAIYHDQHRRLLPFYQQLAAGTAILYPTQTGIPPAGRTTLQSPPTWSVALAFAPDGKTLAVAGGGIPDSRRAGPGAVYLYDVAAGRPRASLQGLQAPVTAAAFSADGKLLATAGADGKLRIWDGATGAAVETLAEAGGGGAVAFAPDRPLLAAAVAGGVRLWDAAARKDVATLAPTPGAVHALAFTPDGRTLAIAGDQGPAFVQLWDVAGKKTRLTLPGHLKPVLALAFTRDGRTLATGGADRTVRVWDARTGRLRFRAREHPATVNGLAFSPDGRTLAAAATPHQHTVLLWDMASGRLRGALPSDDEHTWESVAFAPDGRLATGGYRAVRLWDLRPDSKNVVEPPTAPTPPPGTVTLTAHGDQVRAVAFAPDGRLLASAGHDRTVRLWDAVSLKPQATLQASAPLDVLAFAPDGRSVAAAGAEAADVTLWDVATGQARTAAGPRRAGCLALAFDPADQTLAAAVPGPGVLRWQAQTAAKAPPLNLGGASAHGLAYGPGGKLLATAHTVYGEGANAPPWPTGRADLWELPAGRRLASFSEPMGDVTALAFAPDGATVATGCRQGPVKLWDVAARKLRYVVEVPAGWVTALAFSPDSRLLAIGTHDLTICLWDCAANTLRDVLLGHEGPVTSLAFAPDGRRLASGSEDATVRVWEVLPAPAAADLAPLQRFRLPGGINALALSRDGRRLAVGGWGRTIVVWDLAARPVTARTFAGHRVPIADLAFSPDGTVLASSAHSFKDEEGTSELKLWDVASGRPLDITGYDGHPDRLAFAPDGKLLGVTHWGKVQRIRLYDVPTGKALCTLNGNGAATNLAFTPDGSRVLMAQRYGIVFWATPTDLSPAKPERDEDRPLGRIATPHAYANCLTVSPDGATLAVSGVPDVTTTLWDLGTLQQRQTLPGECAGFAPDGKTVVTTLAPLRLTQPMAWDARTGQAIPPFRGAHTGLLSAFAFLPDGSRLVTASQDGTVKFWDPATGRERWDR